jgi:hypothetical protein
VVGAADMFTDAESSGAMSEWQPALVIDGHKEWGPILSREWKELLGRVVRVSPLPEGHTAGVNYRKFGCTGRIFVVSTEDAGTPMDKLVVCEHEILTD